MSCTGNACGELLCSHCSDVSLWHGIVPGCAFSGADGHRLLTPVPVHRSPEGFTSPPAREAPVVRFVSQFANCRSAEGSQGSWHCSLPSEKPGVTKQSCGLSESFSLSSEPHTAPAHPHPQHFRPPQTAPAVQCQFLCCWNTPSAAVALLVDTASYRPPCCNFMSCDAFAI